MRWGIAWTFDTTVIFPVGILHMSFSALFVNWVLWSIISSIWHWFLTLDINYYLVLHVLVFPWKMVLGEGLLLEFKNKFPLYCCVIATNNEVIVSTLSFCCLRGHCFKKQRKAGSCPCPWPLKFHSLWSLCMMWTMWLTKWWGCLKFFRYVYTCKEDYRHTEA